jgi:hypothetical protein
MTAKTTRRSGTPPCNLRECGDHAWAPLTHGTVTLVSPEDGHWLGFRFWNLMGAGYAAAYIGGKNRKLHRLILGAKDGQLLDHENRWKTDNRRHNLRFCDKGQNTINRGMRADNSTGFKGVWWNKYHEYFTSSITRNGTRHFLGNFAIAEQAAAAYERAAAELHRGFIGPTRARQGGCP